MSNPAIIVMAKAPRPGEAKTRLTPPLTSEEAASLAACLFADTVALTLRVGAAVVVAYAPADGRAPLEENLFAALGEQSPGRVLWLEQRGGDLGERLDGVVACASSRGFGPLDRKSTRLN